MATLKNRKVTRKALATLLDGAGEWNAVYNHMPSEETIKSNDPILVVMSAGTIQEFRSANNNPAEFQYAIKAYVLKEGREADAEDDIDDFDQAIRQTIRDNVGSIGEVDAFRFPDSPSVAAQSILGKLYRTEIWLVLGKVATGT
jgi:hypothetical protein